MKSPGDIGEGLLTIVEQLSSPHFTDKDYKPSKANIVSNNTSARKKNTPLKNTFQDAVLTEKAKDNLIKKLKV